MKILHLSSEYPPAKIYGLGRFVHGLARAQAAQGDQVFVLTNSCGGDEDGVVIDGVHVHRIDFPNPPRPADGHGEVLQFNQGLVARFLDRRAAFEGVDVVCGHDWLTALAAREIASDLKKPLVVTFHDEVIGKRFGCLEAEDKLVRDLESLTAHDATWVIANSEFIGQQVRKHYGVDRVSAIPGGIDPAVLEPSHGVDHFRSILAEENETLVTYVGRLDPEKGLETLAEAALIAGTVKPKLRFAIAGTGKGADAMRGTLAPLGDRVRHLGYVKGQPLSLLYRASDIVVVPSLYEPFGLVALEAMLAGAAVIVSSAGGLAEIVRHEQDGLVVPAGDHVALAEAIVTLAHEEDVRERLASNGQERARTDFSWSRIADRTRDAYTHAIEHHSIEGERPLAPAPPAPSERPLVSVTIVTHNAPVHVETALRSLFNRTDYTNLEAIVVDNGSASTERLDAVAGELRQRGHKIEIVKNATNDLFSKGQNEAIRRARGEYVCLLNDDTEIPAGSEQWLNGLVWLLETTDAGTATPVTLERDDHIYCAGAYAGGGHHLRGERDDARLVSAPRRTEWNNMACLVTRRCYFDEIGYLREDGEYAHYKSDREWCARLTERLGLSHWVHPVRIHHYEQETQRDPFATYAAVRQTRIPASIVLVAYNNLHLTVEAVESVLAGTEPPHELVLVDNGSSDGTKEYFESLRDHLGGSRAVQILSNRENLGYTLAANQGIRAARGESVVLLNNDTRVRPGWLSALLGAARSEPRVGIVTAKILCPDGFVQNAGGILHHPDGSFTLPHAREDRLAPTVADRRHVETAGGPCMLLTRLLLDEVGAFDESYAPAYFEDSDLCLRARAAGFTLLYEPEAEVYHLGKATAAIVAAEGKLPIWQKFEENKRRFYERFDAQLRADEDARRPKARRAARPKRIVLCANRGAITPAAYCEAALLAAGHDVITAGRDQTIDLGPNATAREIVEATGANVDLLLAIEGDTFIPRELDGSSCPTAFWAIDNHIHATDDRGWHYDVAAAFDHVFCAQKDYVERVRRTNEHAVWLPLACDPAVHVVPSATRDLDVAFVGNVLPIHARRRTLLERVARRFKTVARSGLTREDMARLYGRAKVVFNCSLAGDLNMRVFEGLASGALVVTDRIENGLEKLFGDSEHLALYDDHSLERVIEHYLEDTEARERIAQRGQALATTFHTYAARMEQIVRAVDEARASRRRVEEVVS